MTVRCRTCEFGNLSISSYGKRLLELRVPTSLPQVPAPTQTLTDKTHVLNSSHCCCCDTRTPRSRRHACHFLGIRTCPVPTARRVVVRLHRHRRQQGWTCAQLQFFLQYGPPTHVCTSFFSNGMLGYVLDGQRTLILRVSAMKR